MKAPRPSGEGRGGGRGITDDARPPPRSSPHPPRRPHGRRGPWGTGVRNPPRTGLGVRATRALRGPGRVPPALRTLRAGRGPPIHILARPPVSVPHRLIPSGRPRPPRTRRRSRGGPGGPEGEASRPPKAQPRRPAPTASRASEGDGGSGTYGVRGPPRVPRAGLHGHARAEDAGRRGARPASGSRGLQALGGVHPSPTGRVGRPAPSPRPRRDARRGRGRTPGRVRDRGGKPASRAERPGSLYGRQGSPHRAKRPDPPEEGSSWGGRRGYGAFAPPLAGPPRPPHGPRGARPVPSPDTPGTPKGPRRPRGGPGHAASRPPRAGAFLEPPRRRLRAPPGGRDLRHAGGPRKTPPGGRTGQTGGGGLADAPHGPRGAPGDGGEGIGRAPSPVRRPRRGSPGGDPTARGRRGGGACFGRIPRPRAWGGARRRLSLGFRETCEGSRRRASPPFLHAVRTEEARVARTRAPRTFGGRRHARPPGSSRLVPRGLGQAGLRRGGPGHEDVVDG